MDRVVATEGPWFETRAEIKSYGILGGDMVEMTGISKIVLAKEMYGDEKNFGNRCQRANWL